MSDHDFVLLTETGQARLVPKACSSCRFFQSGTQAGTCNYDPPTVALNRGEWDSFRPRVDGHDRACHKWEPKP